MVKAFLLIDLSNSLIETAYSCDGVSVMRALKAKAERVEIGAVGSASSWTFESG
jgi:hypothetical protein